LKLLKPDIYYIILDGYPSEESLLKYRGYDNSEFINYLESSGFYVASNSFSNYPITHQSLASSLNMKYVNYLAEVAGPTSTNPTFLFELIQACQVCQFLQSQGYKYIHFGSWYKPMILNENADININYFKTRIPDFTSMFLDSTFFTMIFPMSDAKVIRDVEFRKTDDFKIENYERTLHNFDVLEKIPQNHEPTFVVAHFTIPHGPHVFDKDGSYLTPEKAKEIPAGEIYHIQVSIINEKIKHLIDKLLTNSDEAPIIIIQGDHGAGGQGVKDWNNATKENLETRLGILNAYYLPSGKESVLYPSISPVNTFRVVFNQYFDTNLEILPEKYYVHNEGNPFQFINVTEKIILN